MLSDKIKYSLHQLFKFVTLILFLCILGYIGDVIAFNQRGMGLVISFAISLVLSLGFYISTSKEYKDKINAEEQKRLDEKNASMHAERRKRGQY